MTFYDLAPPLHVICRNLVLESNCAKLTAARSI